MKTGLLDLPHDLICRVYDALEVEGRSCLNAALPRARRVSKTLKTDAPRDAGLRVISRYMKRPGNAGKRYADLSGRMKGFVAECALVGDPTVARLFPDAPKPDPEEDEVASKLTAHGRALAAILAGDAAAIAKLAPTFTADHVESVDALKDAVALKGTPATLDALRSSGFLTRAGVKLRDIVFSAVSYENEALLRHIAELADDSAIDSDLRDATAYILYPGIASIFAGGYHDTRKIEMLIRVFGDKVPRDAILDTAVRNMNVPLADFLF